MNLIENMLIVHESPGEQWSHYDYTELFDKMSLDYFSFSNEMGDFSFSLEVEGRNSSFEVFIRDFERFTIKELLYDKGVNYDMTPTATEKKYMCIGYLGILSYAKRFFDNVNIGVGE